jgi:hypothetical protein
MLKACCRREERRAWWLRDPENKARLEGERRGGERGREEYPGSEAAEVGAVIEPVEVRVQGHAVEVVRRARCHAIPASSTLTASCRCKRGGGLGVGGGGWAVRWLGDGGNEVVGELAARRLRVDEDRASVVDGRVGPLEVEGVLLLLNFPVLSRNSSSITSPPLLLSSSSFSLPRRGRRRGGRRHPGNPSHAVVLALPYVRVRTLERV